MTTVWTSLKTLVWFNFFTMAPVRAYMTTIGASSSRLVWVKKLSEGLDNKKVIVIAMKIMTLRDVFINITTN